MDILNHISAGQMRDELPEFKVGDTISLKIKVREGDSIRNQKFQGIVIQRRGAGGSATFTVRKVSQGIGVERVFPLHSPNLTSLEVIRRGHVKRSKLYYLRDLRGKAARVKEKKK
ncbi:MAG: 50S ribosomal protein L19 [Candidatus Krumholzibacteriota bacterium]|nr:50S ribosomal protein L19 [Candidatus Krumholzibacteriota bacterium]